MVLNLLQSLNGCQMRMESLTVISPIPTLKTMSVILTDCHKGNSLIKMQGINILNSYKGVADKCYAFVFKDIYICKSNLKNMDKKTICYGYIPSKLDGTEHQAEFGDFKIPTSFSYQPLMPPVRDQGRESTCVCQTLTGMLDVQRNSKTGIMKKCNDFSISELYNQRSNKPQEGMRDRKSVV